MNRLPAHKLHRLSGPGSVTPGAIMLTLSLLLMAPVQAAEHIRPMAGTLATHSHTTRAARSDWRVAEFKRQLAAYKQTVAALRRDALRLEAQQQRLDALVKQLNAGSQLDMIELQSLMSNRQTAVQLSTNLMHALNESANGIVGNVGK
jgi:hypothetical protein